MGDGRGGWELGVGEGGSTLTESVVLVMMAVIKW